MTSGRWYYNGFITQVVQRLGPLQSRKMANGRTSTFKRFAAADRSLRNTISHGKQVRKLAKTSIATASSNPDRYAADGFYVSLYCR